ncbi:MAG: Opine oxidase subunit B2 [uncultured Paraburkholderia sp.]|nr:MAG: Opine oxidase subunit B2 [uncultured Paraburkholderia sp.]
MGGGLVGSAVAYGLAREGARVTVLDEDDGGFRASRGNFGLVWIQGKGYGLSPYARWSRNSATRWPQFAQALLEESGVDGALKQPGGFHFCFNDDELAERDKRLSTLRAELGDYPFQMLDAADVRARIPQIGPAVIGASYTPMDGHVNPLKLLRALHTAMQARGVRLVSAERALGIEPQGHGFMVRGKLGTYRAARVVLAAGLGNRGQVLVSERVVPFLHYPTLNVRQTDEGTVQFGDAMEEVGFDDFTTTHVLADIARRGVRAFPMLRHVRLVRMWAALRVAPWIMGARMPDELPTFSAQRFERATELTLAH